MFLVPNKSEYLIICHI